MSTLSPTKGGVRDEVVVPQPELKGRYLYQGVNFRVYRGIDGNSFACDELGNLLSRSSLHTQVEYMAKWAIGNSNRNKRARLARQLEKIRV